MNLIQQISTTKGFIFRYISHLTIEESKEEAYERTENEHLALFNRRKYSCYNSFRNVKKRYRIQD